MARHMGEPKAWNSCIPSLLLGRSAGFRVSGAVRGGRV
jgi:hypothetical protein